MNRTAARRRAILEVLAEAVVHSQEELAGLLAARGFDTTQPMLSRDLRNLKVAKRGGVYQLVEDERVTPVEKLASPAIRCSFVWMVTRFDALSIFPSIGSMPRRPLPSPGSL